VLHSRCKVVTNSYKNHRASSSTTTHVAAHTSLRTMLHKSICRQPVSCNLVKENTLWGCWCIHCRNPVFLSFALQTFCNNTENTLDYAQIANKLLHVAKFLESYSCKMLINRARYCSFTFCRDSFKQSMTHAELHTHKGPGFVIAHSIVTET